jgi:hypothetical protein
VKKTIKRNPRSSAINFLFKFINIFLTGMQTLFANSPSTQVSPTLHIRLAYLGKILSEKDTLEAQGWKEGHVINAMVVGAGHVVVPESPAAAA